MAEFLENKSRIQRAFLVGVQGPRLPEGEGAELLEELRELVENLGLTVVRTALVNLRGPSPAFLLGRGKALELIAAALQDLNDEGLGAEYQKAKANGFDPNLAVVR